MASSKPASGRRGPSQGAKKASGGVLSQPVTFPVAGPVPRKIEPQECVVRCIGASADGVRVVVLPRVVDVRHMLDSVYGVLGWGDTYYRSGSWWRCQIEVLSPATGQYVRKDAGPLNLPTSDPDRMQENTSFLRAAALLLELNQRAPFTAREALNMSPTANALVRLICALEELHGRHILGGDQILKITEDER